MKWYDIHNQQTLDDVMPAPIRKVIRGCFGTERRFYNDKVYAERVAFLKALDALLRYTPTDEEIAQLNAAGALAETVEETTIREAVLAAEEAIVRRRKSLEHWDDVLAARQDVPAVPKKGRKK